MSFPSCQLFWQVSNVDNELHHRPRTCQRCSESVMLLLRLQTVPHSRLDIWYQLMSSTRSATPVLEVVDQEQSRLDYPINSTRLFYPFLLSIWKTKTVFIILGCCYEVLDTRCELCCKVEATTTFTNFSTPAFEYSYACGAALIVTYVPVLLYSYIAYGLVAPLARFVLCHISDESFLQALVTCMSRLFGN